MNNKNLPEIICSNIRNMRQKHQWSQEYVAEKLNISQNAFSKIELGYSSIRIERLVELADAFEVSVFDLMTDSAS